MIVWDGSHLSEFKHFQFLVRKKHWQKFHKLFTSWRVTSLLCQNLEASKATLQLLLTLVKFWQSAKLWQVFETRAHTYFSIIVYRDIFLIQAKLAQVQPGPNIINFLELINNLSISNKGSHDWAVWVNLAVVSIDFFQLYFSVFSLKCSYDQIFDIHFFAFSYTIGLPWISFQISIYYEV